MHGVICYQSFFILVFIFKITVSANILYFSLNFRAGVSFWKLSSPIQQPISETNSPDLVMLTHNLIGQQFPLQK